ncbi:MAG TPA: hypothetical protein VHB50_01315, partial [Bryobacteraceae bacterium]|nr:hypothetical protein [Bryobacteraceae bacterium]
MFAALALHGILFFAEPPAPPDTSRPVQAEQTSKRTELNLLGSVDSSAGESRRNENVQFNLIDNNALKYLNIRLGTNASITTEFSPEKKYFGTEFGTAPTGQIHLAHPPAPADFHGGISFTRSDSLFSARSFFQVGGVQPAHENDYGLTTTFRLWRGAHAS